MKPKEFALAFSVFCAFIAANIYSHYVMPLNSTIDDGFVYFGWPFDIYREGGFVGVRIIIWTGLIGNVALALCFARVAVAIMRRLRT